MLTEDGLILSGGQTILVLEKYTLETYDLIN